MPISPVRKSTLEVIKHATHVHVSDVAIERLASRWAEYPLVVPPWPKKVHLETPDARTMLDYLIILHTVMFSLWSRAGKWHIVDEGEKFDGYFGLARALANFFIEYPGKANLSYFSMMPLGEFKAIFSGRGRLGFMEKRWTNVRKVSLRLLNEYEGDSRLFVEASKHSARNFIERVSRELYSFNDTFYHKKKKVFFLMRSQMLAANIIGAFEGKGYGKFRDADYLTALADYKLPQILADMGIIEYSDALKSKLKRKRVLAQGSAEEIEIRSGTICAVEANTEALRRKKRSAHAYEVDRLLWHRAHAREPKLPHHFTVSDFY